MSRVVAVDFDDIILDCYTAFAAFHNAAYGTTVTRADIHDWHLEHTFGITRAVALARVNEFLPSTYHAEAQPVPGALAGLAELKRLGYSVVIVTSRSDVAIPYTEAWMNKHIDGLYDTIHYINHFDTEHHKHRTKADVCAEIGAVVLIEDAPHHVESVASASTPVLLFDTPWNQVEITAPNVTRVKSWGEIVDWLKANGA